jgi:hypothetical protein
VTFIVEYLDQNYLSKGINMTDHAAKLPTTTYSMFSDYYMPRSKLSASEIERIFDLEVKAITHPKTYMGIWQMFALASIL